MSNDSWEDRRDAYSDAIDGAHPQAHPDDDANHLRYAQALEMVGNRQTKYALVDLVHWLLTRSVKAEARVLELEKLHRKTHAAALEILDNCYSSDDPIFKIVTFRMLVGG